MALRSFARSFAGGALSNGMARLNARHPWSHNDHFHGWVLDHLPDRRHRALDVGCGQGILAARLAPHFEGVVGIDADPGMRREAAERCATLTNVRIDDGDWTELDGPFDLIAMVAVLHHLDVPAALARVSELLAPGGRFLAVGLDARGSLRDDAWDVASMVTNPIIGFVKHPRPNRDGVRPPAFPVQDPTLAFDDLRALVDEAMPGARMRHRLGFRHTIEWTRPGGPSASFADASPVRRLARVTVTRGPVAAVSSRLLPSADRASVRLTGGRVVLSAWVTGLPIIELTTTGARSGEQRTHRVMGIPDEGGYLVVGANFGGPSDPAWCHNLRASPRASVARTSYDAEELVGPGREAAFARALELNPGWRRFQDRADRPLPVFLLTRR